MAVSFIRTIILYAVVITALRIMGKRQIGELEPSELVVTILVSELAAIPMQDLGIPLFAGVIPIITLISLEIIVSFLCLKSRKLRRLLNGRAAIIIRGGKLDREKMKQMRITTDEVMEALRQQNIGSVSELKYGLIETNGQLSYIYKPEYQPVNAKMLGIKPADAGLPLIVISDGEVVEINLRHLGKTREEIEKRVQKAHISGVSEVFLMTLDDSGKDEAASDSDCTIVGGAGVVYFHAVAAKPSCGRADSAGGSFFFMCWTKRHAGCCGSDRGGAAWVAVAAGAAGINFTAHGAG